jgi:hypothetical protein
MSKSKLANKRQVNRTARMRARPSAMELFGSLKSAKPFPGLKVEKEAARRAVAAQAVREGLK